MIIEKTHKIMKEDNIKAKKMFGQNFLTNKGVLEDIIKASSLSKEDFVIEIGPGLGSLTEQLCLHAKKVLCYEIDNDLALLLPKRLSDYHNFEIVNDDFLNRDIAKDIINYFGETNNIKVIANIPYNITGPIMLNLLKEEKIKTIVLMVQKELALRYSSLPNNKEYGSITVFLAHNGETKLIRTVSRNCFEPAPNVDSAVFRFIRKDIKYDEEFLNFLRKSFSQKRKKITNNLEDVYGYTKSDIEEKLKELGFDENTRAEMIDENKFYQLYLRLKEQK